MKERIINIIIIFKKKTKKKEKISYILELNLSSYYFNHIYSHLLKVQDWKREKILKRKRRFIRRKLEVKKGLLWLGKTNNSYNLALKIMGKMYVKKKFKIKWKKILYSKSFIKIEECWKENIKLKKKTKLKKKQGFYI